MTTFYFCAANGGFYATDLHGERTMTVPDPDWERPTTLIPDPAWSPSADRPGEACPLVAVADMDATHPEITVPNPHCSLPAPEDLVAISAEEHDALMRAQAAGMRLMADSAGHPVAAPPAPPTDDELARKERRYRDALLDDVTDRLQRHTLQKAFGQPTTLTDDVAAALADYAQALRDVPQQDGFPRQIVWPAAPVTDESTPTTEASP